MSSLRGVRAALPEAIDLAFEALDGLLQRRGVGCVLLEDNCQGRAQYTRVGAMEAHRGAEALLCDTVAARTRDALDQAVQAQAAQAVCQAAQHLARRPATASPSSASACCG